jgi:hypothetical protein
MSVGMTEEPKNRATTGVNAHRSPSLRVLRLWSLRGLRLRRDDGYAAEGDEDDNSRHRSK